MKKVYIVFDKLHKEASGGLVATYERLIHLLNDQFEFEIISVVNCGAESDARFGNTKIMNLSKFDFFPQLTDLGLFVQEKRYLEVLKNIFLLMLYLGYIPFARLKLRSLIEKDAVVIAVSPASAMYISANIPFILEVHTQFDYFWNGGIVGKMQKNLMQKPKLALFRTQSDAKKASQFVNASYMYNFFDASCLNEELLIGNKARDKRILFVGRLTPVKNLFKMLDCAKKLKTYYDDFILDIYGEGPLKEQLSSKIKEYGLCDNVFLKGFTSDKNIYNHYSLQWLTSDVEGLALVIIEGDANGVPTISTNWGDGVYEAIHDEIDGYIEDSVDGIVNRTCQLWENKDLLNQVSNNALKNFDTFSSSSAYKKWVDLISNFNE